jgi:hypothetical protein
MAAKKEKNRASKKCSFLKATYKSKIPKRETIQ